ncbi:MAG TPA: hypothetical protein VK530_10625 [Candidatus Acidoferrum sp.]|nr:hypothetical protein [Candidatus Acidoferrum sp.]
MKLICTLLGLLAVAQSLTAQLILNPGDKWDYHFTTLHERITFSPMGIPANSWASLEFDASTFGAGEALKLEMFANHVNESPFHQVTFTPSSPSTITSALDSAWYPDMTGAIRLTMLTGSVTITSVELHGHPMALSGAHPYYMTNFTPQPVPPKLTIVRGSGQVELDWWTNGSAGYMLESTNSVPGAIWTAIAESPTVITGRNHVSISTTGAMQFFRLRQ